MRIESILGILIHTETAWCVLYLLLVHEFPLPINNGDFSSFHDVFGFSKVWIRFLYFLNVNRKDIPGAEFASPSQVARSWYHRGDVCWHWLGRNRHSELAQPKQKQVQSLFAQVSSA